MNSMMTLHSGAQVNILEPSVVDLSDLAWGLAHQLRFGGHLHIPHDVATHSMALCALVPTKWRLRALLHDASEGILGDVVKPLKRQNAMARYRGVEWRWQLHIYAQFELLPYSAQAREMDPTEFEALDLALTLHEAEMLGTSGFARSVNVLYPDAPRLVQRQRRAAMRAIRAVEQESAVDIANTWQRMVIHHAT